MMVYRVCLVGRANTVVAGLIRLDSNAHHLSTSIQLIFTSASRVSEPPYSPTLTLKLGHFAAVNY
jgi:hypothetical protein